MIMVMLYGIIFGNYAQYGLMSAATSIPVVVGGMLVIRLVASRIGQKTGMLVGTLFSFVDKLISSLAGTFVSLMIAAIGFTTTQPTQDSAGIFWVTMACFIGAPMVGWICNLVAMHFYPLSKEFMAEIQEKVAEIKRQAQTENA